MLSDKKPEKNEECIFVTDVTILTFLLQVLDLIGHEVVERMVAALKGLLVREAGLLEQVHHHVCSGELSGRVEVDSREQQVKLKSCDLFREALQKTGVNIKPISLRLKDR